MTDFTTWSDLLLEASRRDFTDGFVTGQQAGPTRTSRAFAIAHLAMRDAATAATDPSLTYLALRHGAAPTPPAGLVEADAIDGAAFRAMAALYPGSRALFETAVGAVHRPSFEFGEGVAQALLDIRAGDGAANEPPYAYAMGYGRHRADPFMPMERPLTPHWGAVAHFVGPRVALDPYPGAALASFLADASYRMDFEEVRNLGARDRGMRTALQETTGVYWGYDGANGIGVPPRLYNQIARVVAADRGLTDRETLSLMTVVNVAMADAGIDAWHWKYVYDLWRPVVGLREEDAADGGDPFWTPYGLPRTNRVGAGPATPGFPAYPSGHATFGAALFQVLRMSLGSAAMTTAEVLAAEAADAPQPGEAFAFVSDELDGKAIDAGGSLRPRVERSYASYARAVSDNALSRVYLGVHWRFDGVPRSAGDMIGGVPLGLEIGRQAHDFFFPPIAVPGMPGYDAADAPA